VIEQRPVAVGRGAELLQKIGEQLHVKFVDLEHLGDLLGIAVGCVSG
jgi:hypothetical protein